MSTGHVERNGCFGWFGMLDAVEWMKPEVLPTKIKHARFLELPAKHKILRKRTGWVTRFQLRVAVLRHDSSTSTTLTIIMSAAPGTVSSIRAQAKKPKVERVASQAGRPPADGRERMDKEIVKAVLASPLIVPW